MFKRRKPDDPIAADAALPAGLAAPEADEAAPARTEVITSAEPSDTGLGVPPFRPAPLSPPPKEGPAMPRTPFPQGSTPQPTPPATAPTPAMPAFPVGASQAPPRAPSPEASERRTLVVGRGISVQGTVQDAERLVVEGTVEASMIHATELAISPGGMFKGEVEVEEAEVAGTFDGTLTARGSLVIRASGRVLGQARYRRLQVEDGGQISGRMEMLTEGSKPEPVIRLAAEHAD